MKTVYALETSKDGGKTWERLGEGPWDDLDGAYDFAENEVCTPGCRVVRVETVTREEVEKVLWCRTPRPREEVKKPADPLPWKVWQRGADGKWTQVMTVLTLPLALELTYLIVERGGGEFAVGNGTREGRWLTRPSTNSFGDRVVKRLKPEENADVTDGPEG